MHTQTELHPVGADAIDAATLSMARSRTVDASRVLGQSNGSILVNFNQRDLILYAIGIGCPSGREDGGPDVFVYEGHPAGFQAFPTYPLVLPFKGSSSDVVAFPGPALNIIPRGLRGLVDPTSILHYDQSLDILRPLDPRGAQMKTRTEVIGLYQRRGGVLVRTKTTLSDLRGRTCSVSTQGTFMRGLKISEDTGAPLPSRPPRPSSPPDAVSKVTVSRDQALVYRLSGDYNAIHADPEAARAAGLQGTILHGLCTLGIAARQVLLCFNPGEPAALKHISCRFSKTVRPGEPLEVMMWKNQKLGQLNNDQRSSNGAGSGQTPADTVQLASPGVPMALMGETTEHGLTRDSDTVNVIRFEVCAPEQGGAVVVADGIAVLDTRLSAMSSQERGSVVPTTWQHRARL